MGQSRSELEAAFEQAKRLHADGKLHTGPAGTVGVRITSVDSPEEVPFSAVARLVDYARAALGVELALVGGGVGCFDLQFVAEGPAGPSLPDAVLDDPALQAILNELRANVLRIRTPHGIQTFAAKSPFKAMLATTRERNPGARSLAELFGGSEGTSPYFGVVDFLITDLTPKQPRASLLKRVWRTVTLGLADIRSQRTIVELTRLDLLDKAKFLAVLNQSEPHGILACVHGYANSFDDAAMASARIAYQCRLDQLGLLPLIFSWPAGDSFIAYERDRTAAQSSELFLEEILRDLASTCPRKTINVLAHSHGNQLVLRSVCAAAASLAGKLSHLIMVAPDVDLKFFAQRVEKLKEAAARVTVYYSTGDRALGAATMLSRRPKLGVAGAEVSDAVDLPTTFEMIDASAVSKGLLRHSPHLESMEVVRDIHDLLEGASPPKRMSLEPLPGAGRWRIRPALMS